MSQARGESGTPDIRQWSTAEVNASCIASSARSKSPTMRISVATSRPQSERYTASTAAVASCAMPNRKYFSPTCRSGRLTGVLQMEAPMKYMFLIHHDEQAWNKRSDSERQPILAEFRQLRQQLLSSGQYVDGSQLSPTASATSVRVRDGKPLVTDGPFAETREQLGGYFVVEAKDREEALAIAAKIPVARWGTIEVRQLLDVPEPATT